MNIPDCTQDLLDSVIPQRVMTMPDTANQATAETTETETYVPTKEDKEQGGSVLNITAKPIRSLNAWIAFRSYYAIIFSTIPQKRISVFLTHLWRFDPTKAKWGIIAKAYSVLREEEGKENAPLKLFLALNAPFLGIVDPENYLRIHGWNITAENGHTVMRRKAQVDTTGFRNSMLTTNASVEDVIRNSYDQGYIKRAGSDRAAPSANGISLTMATSAQPVQPVDGLVSFSALDRVVVAAETQGLLAADALGLPASGGNTVNTGMMRPVQSIDGGVQPLHQTGPHPPTGEVATLVYNDSTSNCQLNADLLPNLSSIAFVPFIHDHFDAFHLSDYNYANGIEWVNDGAY